MDEDDCKVVGKPRAGMMEPSVKTAGKGACRRGEEIPPRLKVKSEQGSMCCLTREGEH